MQADRSQLQAASTMQTRREALENIEDALVLLLRAQVSGTNHSQLQVFLAAVQISLMTQEP